MIKFSKKSNLLRSFETKKTYVYVYACIDRCFNVFWSLFTWKMHSWRKLIAIYVNKNIYPWFSTTFSQYSGNVAILCRKSNDSDTINDPFHTSSAFRNGMTVKLCCIDLNSVSLAILTIRLVTAIAGLYCNNKSINLWHR